MNYKRYLTLAAVITLLIITLQPKSTQAQEPVPSAAPNPTQTPINPEVAALQAQLETMRWYDQRLMTTVWGSLGLVFTLAVGLALYNGWTISQSYERDKETLRAELEATLELRSQELFSEALINLQERLHKRIELESADTKRELTDKLGEMNHELSFLMYDYHRTKIASLHHRNEHYKALLEYPKSYKVIMNINPEKNSLVYNNQISAMLEALQETTAKIDRITSDTVSKINAILDQIPSEHRSTLSDIRKKLRVAQDKWTN